ncbi:MAG: hypothetical protein KC431_31845 [Myxococcales bacterium]|nr:hypothetical protein [Myxococcales bacterium]
MSFEVTPNPEIEDAALRERIRLSIVHLRLNEPTFCETRRYCHDRYLGLPTGRGESGPWPLSWLEEECPFVARELRRQGRLRAGDA